MDLKSGEERRRRIFEGMVASSPEVIYTKLSHPTDRHLLHSGYTIAYDSTKKLEAVIPSKCL
jgi:hypothetical protein